MGSSSHIPEAWSCTIHLYTAQPLLHTCTAQPYAFPICMLQLHSWMHTAVAQLDAHPGCTWEPPPFRKDTLSAPCFPPVSELWLFPAPSECREELLGMG